MCLPAFWMLRKSEGNGTAEYLISDKKAFVTQSSQLGPRQCTDSAMLARAEGQIWSCRGERVRPHQPCLRASQAEALSNKEEKTGLTSSQSQMLLKQLDTLAPAQGSQYLQWAWDRKERSRSSPSRQGNTVSSAEQLPAPRESWEELSALDPAPGVISTAMALWRVPFDSTPQPCPFNSNHLFSTGHALNWAFKLRTSSR